MDLLREALSRLVLPATDRGVVLQAAVAVAVLGWWGWRVRHHAEWRLVAAGSALLLVGLFGLRAAH